MKESNTLKILYGLTLETSKLKDLIEQSLIESGVQFLTICRYRKKGIYQCIQEQNEQTNMVLILEENLQNFSFYEEDEIVQLSDAGDHKIIFLLDRKHYGDNFIKTLYVCGILNAIFIDEVGAEQIVKLIIKGRTNEEARNYYGIQTMRDTEKKENIVNLEYLNTYLEYIEINSKESVNERYQFATSRLNTAENGILAKSLSPMVACQLNKNEIYEFYVKGERKKKFLPWKPKKKQWNNIAKMKNKSKEESLLSQASKKVKLDIEEMDHLCNIYKKEAETYSTEIEKVKESDEDLLTIMERFRLSQNFSNLEDKLEEQREFDLRIEMGKFFQKLDK